MKGTRGLRPRRGMTYVLSMAHVCERPRSVLCSSGQPLESRLPPSGPPFLSMWTWGLTDGSPVSELVGRRFVVGVATGCSLLTRVDWLVPQPAPHLD